MRNFKNTGVMVAACLMLALAFGGCARQHIVSSPPAQRPADRATPRAAEPAPAPEPAPTADPERTRVDEGVYVVDAPVTEDPARQVRELELGEEPLAEEPAHGDALPAAAPKAAETPTEPAPHAEPEAAAETPAPLGDETHTGATTSAMPEVVEGGKYYVQVGAFSDLENANRALARLIADGYKGSKLDATDDGLFRVQAGAFADHDSAELALSRLRADYPKGFVLTTD